MPKLTDLTNYCSGRLTVIKQVPKPNHLKKKSAYWLCKCDCGKEVILISQSLVGYTNQRKSQSCGCLQRELARDLIYKNRTFGNPAENRVFNMYEKRKNKKNIPFTLTKEQFIKLTKLNCFYCGRSPKNIMWNTTKTMSVKYNGVDRINNNEGYNLGNVISCCEQCNKSKRRMTLEEFREWIILIYKNFSAVGNDKIDELKTILATQITSNDT